MTAANTAVDLNTIPYGAVDRIEVLNDGASAIYGSDAVAGVINFITRREFQGLTLNGSLSEPTKSGGGQSYDIGATGGIGSLTEQGWNLFGTVSYRTQSALKATDRSYASTAYYPGTGYRNPVTFPANYFQDTSANYLNPSLPNCDPPDSVAIDDTCNFDYVRYINIIPKQEQLTLMAKGSYALNSSNTLSLEYLQGNNEVTSVVAPTPLQFLEITPSNPFFPGGSGLSGIPGTPASTDPAFNPADPTYLLWRTTNLGSRANTIKNKTDRFLLDLQGSHQGWDYTVAALRSNSNVTNTFDGGYISESGAQAGLFGTSPGSGAAAAPWLNPFGAQTPEGQSYMMNQRILGRVQEAEGTLQGIKADASSEIYKMPAGPLTMAVGLEHYRDKVSFTNNLPLIQQAASSGLEGVQDASGSRDWTGVFVEFNVPVIKELEVNLALRYDHYSDFGSTTNPKAAFRWTPMKQILVRGSINSGFRAPSLYETYSPASTTFTEDIYNDPVLCPGGVVDTAAGGVQGRDCDQFFLQQIGGNQNLQPETSRAWGVGLVLQPTNQTTFSVDYWNYLIEESIGVLGEGTIFGNSDKYSDNFVRCSQLTPDEQASNDRCTVTGGDPLAYIVNTNLNLGSFKTSGLDFAAGLAQPGDRLTADFLWAGKPPMSCSTNTNWSPAAATTTISAPSSTDSRSPAIARY